MISPVFLGQHMIFLLEYRRKAALAVVSDFLGNLRNAQFRRLKQPGGVCHPMLPDMGSDGCPIDGLEELLQSRGVHQILLG